MTATLSTDDLKKLAAPFPRDTLGVKVQSFSKDKTKGMLVLYLQHTDVYSRLEEVDPCWSNKVTTQHSDKGLSVFMSITIKGVTRENVGDGDDWKSATSDALKRTAMLFGVGRHLYDTANVWVPYNEQTDKFKVWTVADYDKAARSAGDKAPTAESAALKEQAGENKTKVDKPFESGLKSPPKGNPPPAKSPVIAHKGEPRSRDVLNKQLMNLYKPYLTAFPATKFVELLHGRYSVAETRLMTVAQMEDLVQFMVSQLDVVPAKQNAPTRELSQGDAITLGAILTECKRLNYDMERINTFCMKKYKNELERLTGAEMTDVLNKLKKEKAAPHGK